MHKSLIEFRLHIISLLISIFLLSATDYMVAQVRDYKSFKNIIPDTEANVITSFTQDYDGLIWLGTNKGLYSYDGYSHYPHFASGDKHSMRIYCMELLDKERILLGTDNTLLIYNRTADAYEEPCELFYGLSAGMIPTDIKSLYLCDGILWIGSLNGLYRLDTSSGEMKRYVSEDNKGLTHNTIYSVVKGDGDNIYLGTYNGLCKVDSRDMSFMEITIPSEIKKSNVFVNTLLYDESSQLLWIGTEGELFSYSLSTGAISKVRNFPINSVKTLTVDNNSNLLVGTDNGLYIIDNNESVCHIAHDSRDVNSLSNNIVWSIFRDSDRNIWIGTDYGVSISLSDRPVEYIPIYDMTGYGDGNHFYSLYCDSKGRKWLGGTNGLICAFDNIADRKSVWYRMSNHDNFISHNRIRDIYEDSDSNLWVATDGSISLFEEKTQRFRRFDITDPSGEMNSNWAYNIMEDDRSRMWVATCLGGIFVIDKDKLLNSGGRCIADYNFNRDNGLSGVFVNQIVADRNNDIWVLLYNNGIDKINANTFEVSHVDLSVAGGGFPNYLLSDKDGHIWIASKGSVISIDPDTHNMQSVSFERDGISEVLSMVEIGEDIWLSTTKGVYIVNKRTHSVSEACNTPISYSSFYYHEGILYMGYSDGMAVCNPEVFRYTPATHDLRLSALYINNRQHLSHKGKSLGFADEISFSHKESDLVFEFSDLPYTSEVKNKFLYRLEGRDNAWNNIARDDNRIVFNSLPYGSYILYIKKDVPGEEAMLSKRFSIIPPFYLGRVAKCIYLIIIMLIIAGIVKYLMVRSILRREKREKAIIIEQTRQKIAFYDNVSHQFTEPLSKIISPVSRMLMAVETEEQLSDLASVQSNALKINAMIHDMLEFERLDKSRNTLILSSVDIISLINRVLNPFNEGILGKKSITVTFNSDMPALMLNVDMLKIEAVVSSIISNAAKFTPASGMIDIAVMKNGADNIIHIKDNGIGIPEKDLPYVTQRFFQSSNNRERKDGTGIGLYLAKSFTEMHGGTISIKSHEGYGTEVIIILPAIEIDEIKNQTEDPETLLIHSMGLMGRNDKRSFDAGINDNCEPSAEQLFLNGVTSAIEDRIDDFDLNVTSLCVQLNVNSKQMYRKIKQLTGHTPVEYIKVIRMKKAAVLLKQNKFAVSEVVYMVGFSNASYFSKCFQSEFGVTPKQYMESSKTAQKSVLS